MKKLKNIKIIIFIAIIGLSIQMYLQAQSIEYSIKASFIEKFARFTDWGELNSDSFVIAVLGENPFNGELERLAKKVKIKNKPVKILYIKNYTESFNSNILFISASEKNKIREITKYVEQFRILTVSDTPGFCSKGVHLNFYLDDSETIKYEVNPTAIKKSKLIVEMQLLSYGTIISN